MTSEAPRSRSIFAYRDFTIYVAGGFASNSGTWLQNIVASVYMLSLTDSVFMVGVLNFASFLPILLFSLIGGVVSDSYRRRDIVISTHLISMVLAVALAVLALTGSAQPWHLIVVAFLINTTYAFAKPALTSLLPALVPRERLPEATAINSLQFTGGQMVGSAVAAATLYFGNAGWGFALNSVTFLGPIVAMLLIRSSARLAEGRPTEGGLKAFREGMGYIRRDPLILFLFMGIAMGSIVAEAMRTLSPAFATRVLGADESVTGVLIGGYAVGSAIAILTVPRLLRLLTPGRLSLIGFSVQGAGVAIFAVAPTLPVALLGTALIGSGFSYNLPMLTARLVDHAPDRLRGRVMSMHTLANLGSRPVAALSAGTLAALLGARLAMLAYVLVAAVGIAVVVVSNRRAGEGQPTGVAPPEPTRGGTVDPEATAASTAAVAGASGAGVPDEIAGDAARPGRRAALGREGRS